MIAFKTVQKNVKNAYEFSSTDIEAEEELGRVTTILNTII